MNVSKGMNSIRNGNCSCAAYHVLITPQTKTFPKISKLLSTFHWSYPEYSTVTSERLLLR